ncbi:flagellar export chaperone FliS [Celerinatantimonas diazotrophica]|uniref:Flagellar secretion chaperone FliS n=1 Tax=Celerinatantimonas diazotrophica TaxID=412034 RepID=A0A4R1JMH4_9GAMM|nr:flagellar export chaperone FliS [Celerinatantimonas diazotrophica]TCK52160.1 flagellar protein FliS [Celerinatantimonas diazotrophica]CAG9296135.1 Flagellar secretion chaperone FliS [Celerinatantimonas diazotrophica]
MYKKGIHQYRQVGIRDQIATADPHKITQLLMQSALENLAIAKGCIERKDLANKAKPIAKATAIISSLRSTLDHEAGGEISRNLDDLYSFMLEHLSEASVTNDPQQIADVIEILLPIKSAWDNIPESAKQEAYNQRNAV